jgi:hypothetical protein
LADLLEDRVHRMCPLVAVLDAQNAGAPSFHSVASV